MRVNGLFGHIQRNNTRSFLLLAAFLLLFELLHVMSVVTPVLDKRHVQRAVASVTQVFTHKPPAPEAEATTEREAIERDLIDSPFMQAMRRNMWWQTLVLAGIWFAAAWLVYKYALQAATGARSASRMTQPRLFNLVENLSMQAGLPCPDIQIVDSDARNAWSAGFSADAATIVVTRGLLEALNDRELKAVLAHEIVHIRNHDIRLMAINAIFCGIVFGAAWRMLDQGVRRGAFLLALVPPFTFMIPFVLWIIAVVILGAWMARFAVSRTREFVADAGAVELTHDPMGLALALRKIEGRETVDGADHSMQQMMFTAATGGLFASHPSPRERISALRVVLPEMTSADAVDRAADREEDLNWATLRETAAQMPKWLMRPVIVAPVAVLTLLVNYGVARIVDPNYASALLMLRTGGYGGDFALRGVQQAADGEAAPTTPAQPTFEDYFGVNQELNGGKADVYLAQITKGRTKIASCFPLGFSDPYQPGRAAFAYTPTDDESIRNNASDRTLYQAWQYKETMVFAMNDCLAHLCTGERLSFYKSQLSSYILYKMILVRDYDQKYGTMGLGFAQNFYRSARDQTIIADVKTRIGRGQIDLREFPKEYDALRMTLEKRPDEFLPCHRKGEWREGLGEQVTVTEKGKRFWD